MVTRRNFLAALCWVSVGFPSPYRLTKSRCRAHGIELERNPLSPREVVAAAGAAVWRRWRRGRGGGNGGDEAGGNGAETGRRRNGKRRRQFEFRPGKRKSTTP